MSQKLKPKPNQSPPKNSFWGDGRETILIAHRGGDAAGHSKRNTLAGFKEAVKLGYQYCETDVINTKDGKVIVSHGAKTPITARLRGTFSHKILQGMTYSQITRHLRVDGQRIPLLEDLLAYFPKTKFFIDPKTNEVVLPLAKLIKRLKAQDRLCVGSFRYDRVKTFQKIMGADKAHTSLVIGRGYGFRNPKLDMLKTGRLSDVEAVQLHHSLVSREMINLVQARGFRALIWTANSPLAIKNAITCGADGVISDKIKLLKELSEVQ